MLHVREEDVDFEDGVEARAGGGEDRGQVADALVLWVGRVRGLDVTFLCVKWNGLDWAGSELTVRSATVPGAIFPVFGSMPTAPEQYTVLFAMMAWERTSGGLRC